MLFRRARPMDELLGDSGFAYHTGQLIGAAEMTAHWMEMSTDPDTQAMGRKMNEAVNWFFKDTQGKGTIGKGVSNP